MTGTVYKWADGSWGFVKGDDGHTYSLGRHQFRGRPWVGLRVAFEIDTSDPRHPAAVRARRAEAVSQ
jgi:hypothetical protein